MLKRIKINREIKSLRAEYYELSGGYGGFSKNERRRNIYLANDKYELKESLRADSLLRKLNKPGLTESEKFKLQSELNKISKNINLTKLESYDSKELKLYDEFLKKVDEIKSRY